MTGITASIAGMIGTGNTTLSECASLLGITREQLGDRLALMERQGFIARQEDIAPKRDCTCGHCCATCCKQDSTAPAIRYILTQKGEQLARIVQGT